MRLSAQMLKIILAICQRQGLEQCLSHSSESELGESTVEGSDGFVSGGSGLGGGLGLGGSVELGGLGLSAGFESIDEVSLSPSGELGDVSQDGEVSVRFHSQDLEGVGDNHALLLVVRVWDTVEETEGSKGSSTSGGFVGEHSSDVLPEHARGSKGVLESTSRVSVDSLSLHLLPDELVAEERSGSEDLFATDNNDSLAAEELSGNNGCEAATEVTTTVNDNLLFEHA
jgi:hypothetical protein